jgi:hypothetical protein
MCRKPSTRRSGIERKKGRRRVPKHEQQIEDKRDPPLWRIIRQQEMGRDKNQFILFEDLRTGKWHEALITRGDYSAAKVRELGNSLIS